MSKKFEKPAGGKLAVAVGAAIGSAAIAAAVLYARNTMRKEMPAIDEGQFPSSTHPPETD